MKNIISVLKKGLDVILTCLIILIPLGYIFGVIRTETLVCEWDKGLPLVMGFVFVPLCTIVTAVMAYNCIKSLTDIGKWCSTKYGGFYMKGSLGITAFVILLAPTLFLLWGSLRMILEVTGIIRLGMFTY